jgi:hypothetical protein
MRNNQLWGYTDVPIHGISKGNNTIHLIGRQFPFAFYYHHKLSICES